jgi:hypothetical protein
MDADRQILRKNLLGWGLELAPIQSGVDLARDLVLAPRAPGGPRALATVEGIDNLGQALTVALTTPLTGDVFNVDFGFDGLNALAGAGAHPRVGGDAPAQGAAHPPHRRREPAGLGVDVVGARAFMAGGREAGPDDARLAAPSLALARAANVELLRVHWQPDTDAAAPPVFLEASAWIDLAAPAVADAVTERCLGYSCADAPPAPGKAVA